MARNRNGAFDNGKETKLGMAKCKKTLNGTLSNHRHPPIQQPIKTTTLGFETASDRDISNDENNHDQQVAPQKQEEERDHKNDAESKLEGNRLFVEGKYKVALVKYEVALGVASGLETNELRSICHLNHGICFFKLEKYEDTIREFIKALKLNPKYM
ncbi:hypothetical protein QYF36_006709 [Acer negundo]|nr:hypothetical protein QYF36_006709 [Acer negundo]